MWSLAHAPTMLVREPAQERKQKLKNELYRMQKKNGQELLAQTLASTHAARSRACRALPHWRVGVVLCLAP